LTITLVIECRCFLLLSEKMLFAALFLGRTAGAASAAGFPRLQILRSLINNKSGVTDNDCRNDILYHIKYPAFLISPQTLGLNLPNHRICGFQLKKSCLPEQAADLEDQS
jgi:hypothetical protein